MKSKAYLLAASLACFIPTAYSQPATAVAAVGVELRGTVQFGAEQAVTWQLVSAQAIRQLAGQNLTLQLADQTGAAAGDLTISPWPDSLQNDRLQSNRSIKGGLLVGLPKQSIRPGAINVTGSRVPQPFGPVTRLVVQQRGAKSPVMFVQTRAMSGQPVVPGWYAVYLGNSWVFETEARMAQLRTRVASEPPAPSARARPALQPQRLRSQGRDWCVSSFARAENQESPPLLDWIAVVTPSKRRCAV